VSPINTVTGTSCGFREHRNRNVLWFLWFCNTVTGTSCGLFRGFLPFIPYSIFYLLFTPSTMLQTVSPVERLRAFGTYYLPPTKYYLLVSIMIGFEWTICRDIQIFALFFGQLGQFCAQLVQMQSRNFFVQMFWQHKHTNLIFFSE